MPYHDDLLRPAFDLVHKEPATATEADLRRSVSAAYYALFHLLISETVANWSLDTSRNGLSRMFEHRVMAKASARILENKSFPFSGEDPAVVKRLKTVARTFGELQEQRHIADYDNATHWTQNDALAAERAFTAWHSIKNEKIAQDYLVSLLIKPRN